MIDITKLIDLNQLNKSKEMKGNIRTVKAKQILNMPIEIYDWKFQKSKYDDNKNGQVCYFYLKFKNENCKFYTCSKLLLKCAHMLQQLRKQNKFEENQTILCKLVVVPNTRSYTFQQVKN